MDHEACRMWNPHWEQEVLIDKKIAPLLSIIWYEFGFQTLNSCEDNFGSVWVNFAELEEMESFLSIIAQVRDEDPELYSEMREDWKYKIVPNDLAEEVDFENDEVSYVGPSSIIFCASLRFPKEDLDRVMEVLRSRL